MVLKPLLSVVLEGDLPTLKIEAMITLSRTAAATPAQITLLNWFGPIFVSTPSANPTTSAAYNPSLISMRKLANLCYTSGLILFEHLLQ